MDPQFSFIMAARNAEKTVGQAIESVQAQEISDWRLLIVDDGSTDDTVGIARSYDSDFRITYLRQETSRGAAAARNYGIDKTMSPWIVVMDSDDVSLPNRLTVAHRMIDEFPDTTAVAGQLAEFGTWGGPIKASWPTDDAAIRRRQLAGRMPIPHPSTTFRRSALADVGGYDEACLRSEDYSLFLRLGMTELRCTSEIVVHYRTQRPLPLKYVLQSGRYGALARLRSKNCDRDQAPTSLSTGQRLAADTRSVYSLFRNRLHEAKSTISGSS